VRLEDYALVGDTQTAALIGKNGSIDWLCLPRFDSPACFAALLGDKRNGYWSIAPAETPKHVERRYRDGSLVLETTFTCPSGSVVLTDAMLLDSDRNRMLRTVTGLSGSVALHMEYVVRFDYGSIVPWVRRTERGLLAVAGPDALLLASDVETHPEGLSTVADFTVASGRQVVFELTYFPSEQPWPDARSHEGALGATEASWKKWSQAGTYDGPYHAIVERSLLTLRALTFANTGGIVAAPTTSLPEQIGGVRNWDYRYCWLRDATFVLYALMAAGYSQAASDWRAWLLRAVAGSPHDLQIVYGIRGTRRLPELELPWLAGYEQSKPVRIGNDAHGQFQLDVYGEVIDLLFAAHRFGIASTDDEWELAKQIVSVVEERWAEPDRGIWEIRGDPQHFTHSKVMAWVALDRVVHAVEQHGYDGPIERWRSVRDAIHAQVCTQAYDEGRKTFTQYYGSRELDASTLMIPLVGFLPKDDPRVIGTIAAIERELTYDGLVMRYTQGTPGTADGLPPGEGAFLACSFWLVDCFALVGRKDDATALFERLIALCNDVGLLSEEYDQRLKRQVGNFPQAFSHLGLINSAFNLSHETRPAHVRSEGA